MSASDDGLIGWRVDAGGHVIPGSVKVSCADCQTQVWIAPSGQRRIKAKPGMIVVCGPCGAKRIAEDPNPVIEPIRADQRAEILTYLRRN